MKILVVDDSRDSADMLASLIAAKGHQVRVAYTGTEGGRFIEDMDFDMAFLDHHLPGMTGVDLARRLRQRAPQTVVIMVTGEDILTEKYAALVGADEYMGKPFSTQWVDRVLEKYEGEKPC